MKKTAYFFALVALGLLAACESKEQKAPEVIDLKVEATPEDPIADPFQKDTLKGSIERKIRGKVGSADISIRYYSPAVRGRIIWGGLVPFNQVWVTGAHMATAFECSKDLKINGEALPAGTYTIFTIPTQNEWTVIVNKNWEQHLADEYDAKDDVIRFKVRPQTSPDTLQRLTYFIAPKAEGKTEIAVGWETLKIAFEAEED